MITKDERDLSDVIVTRFQPKSVSISVTVWNYHMIGSSRLFENWQSITFRQTFLPPTFVLCMRYILGHPCMCYESITYQGNFTMQTTSLKLTYKYQENSNLSGGL